MNQEMIWASDGYLHQAFMRGTIETEKIMADFDKLLTLWELIYSK